MADKIADELLGQLDAYAANRHHSFITTQQMARSPRQSSACFSTTPRISG